MSVDRKVSAGHHAGVSVELFFDDRAGNPYYEFDTLGSLLVRSDCQWAGMDGTETRNVCWRCDEWTAGMAARYLTLMEGYAAAVPFRINDYGGVSYVTDGDEDLRYVTGFIVTTDQRCEQLGVVSRGEALATDIAAEFGEFCAWLEGEVFGYVVAGGSPDEDSCWGFYGEEYAREMAKEAAEDVATARARRLTGGIADVAAYALRLRGGVLASSSQREEG